MIHPLGNKTHHYGFRFLDTDKLGRVHPGSDPNGPGPGNADMGLPVYSIADGLLMGYYDDNGKTGWGKMIMVYHPKLTVYSVYAHIDNPINMVTQWVKEGEQIATLSNAYGKWSAHLHFEIRKGNTYPIQFYPPKSWTKADVKKHYHNPTKFIEKHKNMPITPPHYDGKEVQKQYYAFWGWDIPMKDAIKEAEKYKNRGHELTTKLMNAPKCKKWFEKIGNMEDEIKELKENAVKCDKLEKIKPELFDTLDKLNNIVQKLN